MAGQTDFYREDRRPGVDHESMTGFFYTLKCLIMKPIALVSIFVYLGIQSALIVMKLCNGLNWNWWIILTPILALLIAGIFIFLLIHYVKL